MNTVEVKINYKIDKWFLPWASFKCPYCKKRSRVLYVFKFNNLYTQMCHICFKYNNIDRERDKK